jgi:hypothetical protein
LKRSILGLLILIMGAAGLGYWLFRGRPDWYQPASMSPEQRSAAARSAEGKFRATYNFAAKLQADEQKRLRATAATTAAPGGGSPATQAGAGFTMTFVENELNAFFDKWSSVHRWDQHYGAYLSEPAVVLRDGKLVLAGMMKELDVVASVHFRPGVTEDGRLLLTFENVYAGRLPMPQMMWDQHRQTLMQSLREKLPAWREEAEISPSGVANSNAVSAAMATMMLDLLGHDSQGESTLFLPISPVDEGAVPVRVREVTIKNRELTLSVEQLSPPERTALLKRIREDTDVLTASGQ